MASISLNGITKVFSSDGPPALSEVDLDIADGEFIVLVGPSGCGKTTLLRIVAGLETSSGGELHIDGADVSNVPAGTRNIAMVFQNYALFPHLTVAENIGFGLKIRGVKKAERLAQVENVASLLGLSPYLARRPGELSGGQRQRVAMGRAIIRQPAAFLMDEPLSNLDAKLRVEMRGEISRMQRRLQATTIYVTHDQTEAMTMGDRVVVLNQGVVQQIGSPEHLYSNPANVFVAKFIGAPTMNMLVGSFDGEHLEVGSAKLSLHNRYAPQSGEVQVGVRPEHLSMAAAGEGHFKGKVVLVEHLGKEVQVHMELSEAGQQEASELIAIVDPSEAPQEDTEAEISIDNINKVHLFELDSGNTLTKL
ncbi:MAG: sn-glycerol-3-phosphate ABC transporter ATP-binding protein UgpC [bacterium]|nr:sn-glycerol-3-phosphate ABC transporter ATP-binding protein UgpC [bacterium]